jgi:hypothetical protein
MTKLGSNHVAVRYVSSMVVTLCARALQCFGVHLDCLTLQLKHDILPYFCDVTLTMSVAL